MKKIILAIIICVSVINATAQKCTEVKQGKFRITGDETNPNESILTRTAEHQFEEVKSKGLKFQFDIKWTSDCTYELSKPRVIKGDYPYFSDGQVVYVKITKVTSKYYSAEITSNFAEFKMTKDIQIIK